MTTNKEKEDILFSIQNREEINTICSFLKNAHLAYRGGNSGIPFDEDDPIIVLHINDDHENKIYLKSDGSFYNGSSKFMDRENDVSSLVEYIVENHS